METREDNPCCSVIFRDIVYTGCTCNTERFHYDLGENKNIPIANFATAPTNPRNGGENILIVTKYTLL